MPDSPDSIENVKAILRTLVTPDALIAFCGQMPTYTPKESSRWALAAQVAPPQAWSVLLLEGLVHNGAWSHMLPRTDLSDSLRNNLTILLASGLRRDFQSVAWRQANEAMSMSIDQGYLSARSSAARTIFHVATEKRRKIARRSAMSLALRLPDLTDADLEVLTKDSREFQARIAAHPSAGPLTYAGIARDIAEDPTPLEDDDWFPLYSQSGARDCPALEAEAVRALGRRSPPQAPDGRRQSGTYSSVEGLWWDVVESSFRRIESARRRKEAPGQRDIDSIRALLPRLMADANSPSHALDAIRQADPVTQDLLRGTFSAENLADAAQSAYADSRLAAIFLSQWGETPISPESVAERPPETLSPSSRLPK